MSITARRAFEAIRYREWWIGLPAPLWLVSRNVIARFIEKKGLKAVPRINLLGDDPIPIFGPGPAGENPGPAVAARAFIDRRPFPGGIRIPHLHFEGEIYTLSQQDWQEFAGERVGELREKLGQVGTVGFDELVELSNAIDTLV